MSGVYQNEVKDGRCQLGFSFRWKLKQHTITPDWDNYDGWPWLSRLESTKTQQQGTSIRIFLIRSLKLRRTTYVWPHMLVTGHIKEHGSGFFAFCLLVISLAGKFICLVAEVLLHWCENLLLYSNVDWWPAETSSFVDWTTMRFLAFPSRDSQCWARQSNK